MADQVLPTPRGLPADRSATPARGPWRPAGAARFRTGDLRLLPLALFLVLAIAGPVVFTGDPAAQDLGARLTAPGWVSGSWSHPLGTDGIGRDVLSRMVEGARTSLVVGLIASLLSAAIGVSLALLAAQRRGVIDAAITMLVEIVLAVPLIVVGIVVTAILGPSLRNLMVLLVFVGWINYARVVRLEARRIGRSDFVGASRAMGASSLRVTVRHILPNSLPIAVVIFCQQVAAVMIWEASLTFLGLGLPIEQVTLGGMIRDGQTNLYDAWWVSVMPGIGIALAVVAFHGLAEWVRDELDPVTARRWKAPQVRRTGVEWTRGRRGLSHR